MRFVGKKIFSWRTAGACRREACVPPPPAIATASGIDETNKKNSGKEVFFCKRHCGGRSSRAPSGGVAGARRIPCERNSEPPPKKKLQKSVDSKKKRD
ncbi:hypothetical protein [Xanthomonas maliensis]|uniref:hypothetical protein n=1 Tax=Xanthomonas maliensis TaxID=1321368 RepID=UPI0012DBFEF8|nr:hypothetical protein [Xanthomonas maliensis]